MGLKDGLSNPVTTSGIIDSKGYLWVCTDFSLNRYDGTFNQLFLGRPEALYFDLQEDTSIEDRSCIKNP